MNKKKFIKLMKESLDELIDNMQSSFGDPIKDCCLNNSKVIDTRLRLEHDTGFYYVKRRRECIVCNFRWTTRESDAQNLYIQTKNYY